MNVLFITLTLISFVSLLIGLINPPLILRWLPHNKKTRKSVYKYFGIPTIAFSLIFSINILLTDGVKNSYLNIQLSENEIADKEAFEEGRKEEFERVKKEAEAFDEFLKAEEQAKLEALTDIQKQAMQTAEDYLELSPCSKKALITKLEEDGFSNSDIKAMMEVLNVNWQEQADKIAKDYLDYTALSRGNLIKQLMNEGFDEAIASNAAASAGL